MKKAVAITLLTVLLLVVGYLQHSYIFNIGNGQLPLFVHRSHYDHSEYSIYELLTLSDPRALSMLVYALVSCMLSAGIVTLYFLEKKYLSLTIMVYGIIYLIAILCFLFFYLVGQTRIGYTIFVDTKNGLCTPFATVLWFMSIFIYKKVNSVSAN